MRHNLCPIFKNTEESLQCCSELKKNDTFSNLIQQTSQMYILDLPEVMTLQTYLSFLLVLMYQNLEVWSAKILGTELRKSHVKTKNLFLRTIVANFFPDFLQQWSRWENQDMWFSHPLISIFLGSEQLQTASLACLTFDLKKMLVFSKQIAGKLTGFFEQLCRKIKWLQNF